MMYNAKIAMETDKFVKHAMLTSLSKTEAAFQLDQTVLITVKPEELANHAIMVNFKF